MQFFKTMMIAASGMLAQSERMRVISENMANANSTGDNPEMDPYRRKVVSFSSELDREMGIERVKMGKTTLDPSNFGSRYEPGHPAADENGYVKTPNVKTLIESVDMREAQRTYEANLNVISASRAMMARTIDLLRG